MNAVVWQDPECSCDAQLRMKSCDGILKLTAKLQKCSCVAESRTHFDGSIRMHCGGKESNKESEHKWLCGNIPNAFGKYRQITQNTVVNPKAENRYTNNKIPVGTL